MGAIFNSILAALSAASLVYLLLNPLYGRKKHTWWRLATLVLTGVTVIAISPGPYFLLGALPVIASMLWFTRYLYQQLHQRFKFTWLEYFYYLNILTTATTAVALSMETINSRAAVMTMYGGMRMHHSLFSFDLLFTLGVTALAVMSMAGGTYLFAWAVEKVTQHLPLRKRKVNTQNTKTTANSSLIKHYQDQGLTDEDIDYFRQQMAQTRDRINRMEVTFKQSARLRAIEEKQNTIAVCQGFFKDIVDEPQRLQEASDFILTYLPSLEDLIDKYNEISQHVAKNKQTYLILDKAAETILELSEEIKSAYIDFHQQTYDDLEDEVAFTKRNIYRQTKSKEHDHHE